MNNAVQINKKTTSGFPPYPKIATALVTDNSSKFVSELLPLLKNKNIPTFLVDNSTDRIASQYRKKFQSHVSFLECQSPVNANSAINCAVLAALSAGSEYILLLQGNILPERDVFDRLALFLDRHSEFVFVKPKINKSDDRSLFTYSPFHEHVEIEDFSSTEGLPPFCYPAKKKQNTEFMPVDFADPLFLMVRSWSIHKFGVMDWNCNDISGAAEWTLRLGNAPGKGAVLNTESVTLTPDVVTTPKLERLYYLQLGIFRFLSRCGGSASGANLIRRHLEQYFKSLLCSRRAGKTEIYRALKYAFWNSLKGRYGRLNIKFQSRAKGNRPERAFFKNKIAEFGTSLFLKGLAWLTFPLLYKSILPGKPPEQLWPLLTKLRIDPKIGQPWARFHASHFKVAADIPEWLHDIPTIDDPVDYFLFLLKKLLEAIQFKLRVPVTPKPSDALLKKCRPQKTSGRSNHPGPPSDYFGYDKWCQMRDRLATKKYLFRHNGDRPLFSVLVPVCDPKPEWLEACIDSVRAQTYTGWELILADDASEKHVKEAIKAATESDPRIFPVYNKNRSGISNCTNHAAQEARGRYLVFLDHDDILDQYALAAFALAIQEDSKDGPVDVLYADEDFFNDDDSRVRHSPNFKPQYSPDLHLATNYIHHPVVIRNALFKKLNGLRSHYDGSQDHDLLLRAEEIGRPFLHVPDVLYHMRIHQKSLAAGPQAKPEAHRRDRILIAEALERRKIDGTVSPAADGLPGYSVIKRKMSQKCSIAVLIIPDGSSSPDEAADLWEGCDYLHGNPRQTVAEQVNTLAHMTEKEILMIVSSEIRPVEGWQETIVPHILRNEIGLVTGKLNYHNETLYSCGLVLGIGGTFGRWHKDWPSKEPGFGGWMVLDHEVSAVPWRCLGIRRQLFIDNGMFDSGYRSHGFEVDLALRLSNAKGLRHLAIPGAKFCFAEGYPIKAQEDWAVDDLARLWESWGHILSKDDPYCNPNFTRYHKGIWMHDEFERDLRSRGWFTAYDYLTARLLIGRTGE